VEVKRVIASTRATLAGALLAGATALWCCLPGLALAAPRAMLSAALTPEHLGGGTTVEFGFTISHPPPGQPPSPLTEVDLSFPANIGIATSGLGLSTCTPATLEAEGPPGCPSNSVMGYGSALVEVPFGPEILNETARITTFMAPIQNGHLGLLFYADGETPVSAQLVFPGLILPAPAPFGGTLDTTLPLVPSVPEAPDAAIVQLSSTIGPSHITYYEYTRRKTIPYHPRGIRLPKRCPRGGFPFAAELTFYQGDHAAAHATVPCPRRR
jgi:hypothetical protein